jgi:ribosomal protein S18 acetylase RimI-like enzyme
MMRAPRAIHTSTQTLAGITIRPAHGMDAWAVRALFGALHAYNAGLNPQFALAEGWEDVLREHLDHADEATSGLTLLAWDGETPVGLLMMDGHTDSPLFQYRHWADITALYVAPERRGQAVADALVGTGTRWARARGYDRIQLYVTSSNIPAKRFYNRVGFEVMQEIWFTHVEDAESFLVDDPFRDVA